MFSVDKQYYKLYIQITVLLLDENVNAGLYNAEVRFLSINLNIYHKPTCATEVI